MAEQTEARHVGDRVRRDSVQQRRDVGVQRLHQGDRRRERLVAHASFLAAVDEESGAQRLRQVELVAGARAALRPDRIRRHGADDRQAVERLLVAQRVAAGQHTARLAHLRRGTREHGGNRLAGQRLRKRSDRQCDERRRAHGEDVVERVRGGDRAEVAGVVDDRREEVDREDERALVVELVDRRVVGGREPDEEIRIGLDRQGADEVLQQRRRVLRRAASTRYELREPDLAGRGHLPTL